VTSERGSLLRVDVGICERLCERTAPRMEVHGQGVLRHFEELTPAPGAGLGCALHPLLTRCGEGALEIAPKGPGMADADSLKAHTIASLAYAPCRKHDADARASLPLPPVSQEGPEHVRNSEQLRAPCLLPRRIAPLEVVGVDCVPKQRVQVAGTQATEHARNARHRLPFAHRHLCALL
jgi:hypothetical protein